MTIVSDCGMLLIVELFSVPQVGKHISFLPWGKDSYKDTLDFFSNSLQLLHVSLVKKINVKTTQGLVEFFFQLIFHHTIHSPQEFTVYVACMLMIVIIFPIRYEQIHFLVS